MAKAKTSRELRAQEGDKIDFNGVSFSLGNIIKRWDNHVSARINPPEDSPLGGPFDLHEWESIRMGDIVLRTKQMTAAGDGKKGEVIFSVERL